MWDIVWRRQYPVPLERWPEHLVHRFYLYVRDNIAPDYWAGSFASPLAGAVLPQ